MKPYEIKPHFTKGSYHDKDILRECLSVDMLLPELSVLRETNLFGSLTLELVSTMHWSRQYELPWSIDVSRLESHHLVLDAGCGYSSTKYFAARRARKVVGIDLNQDYLDIANNGCKKLKLDNVELYNSDISSFKYNEKFDRVFCISVLEHDPSHDNRIKCLDNIINHLKPGGLFIFTYDVTYKLGQADFYVDESQSNIMLEHLGFGPLYGKDAAFSGKIGEIGPLTTVCLVYQKPY